MLLPFPAVKRIRISEREGRGRRDPLGIGQVADDFADRRRQFPHQRRHGQNLVALRELRIFHQVDDLDAVATGQVLFAELLEIAKGGDRFRSRSGDVEPQIPLSLALATAAFRFGQRYRRFHDCFPP